MATFDDFITSLRNEFGEQDAGIKFLVFNFSNGRECGRNVVFTKIVTAPRTCVGNNIQSLNHIGYYQVSWVFRIKK